MNNAPIGIFDSGVGGLTVARAILDVLPHEQLMYVGDTAHTPYGEKSLALVRSYALAVMDELVESGVKALVIACNTASSAVLHDARERYTAARGIPVVEVILPAAHEALQASTTKRIGVIATRATVASHAYQDTLEVVPGVRAFAQACPRFVEFAEAGDMTSPELIHAARGYLEPLLAHDIDTLVLGCTHYPLLAGVISYVVGDDVTLVSSSTATARRLYTTLLEAGLMRDVTQPIPEHRFMTTGPGGELLALARRILGSSIDSLEPMAGGGMSA